MDTIEIKIEKAYNFPIGYVADVVHFFINGRNVIGLIHDIESPIQSRKPDDFASYIGLPVDDILPPSRHLLDEPSPRYVYRDYQDKRMILTCLCGVDGCNCIIVKIGMGTDTITWSDFENPTQIEPVNYGELSFVFDRKQYESELLKREYFETINSFKGPFDDYKPIKW